MSLALALWLMLASAALAFYLGRKRGRADYAQHVERELDPLLPLLEELSRDAAAFQRLSAEQSEALTRIREGARLN